MTKKLNVCINHKFNLLDHAGIVAKTGSVRQAAVHEGDHNTGGVTIQQHMD